jgi:PKHD-type hydroxylase
VKNLWEVWPAALSSEYCEYIIQKAKKRPPVDATIGFESGGVPNSNHRTSTIRWLDVFNEDRDISETLMGFIRMSNRTNFGFDISTMNEIQFTEYHGDSKGHYDWHHDVYWENPMPYDRKLSIVVQLSDPTDYEGGQFEFFGIPSPGDEWKQRGSVLIFPSFFYHRVLPVTRGHRISLVSWIEGTKWS